VTTPRTRLVALAGLSTAAALLTTVAAPSSASRAAGRSPTSRTFLLGPGRAERRFLLREPRGVILLSQLTVPVGVRAYVDAAIPHLAGVRVSTGRPNDPGLRCRRSGGSIACTQSQEWCPMPAATWRLRLVKQSGPAGPIRIDYVVGPPPIND
jgi:hypothetical protein